MIEKYNATMIIISQQKIMNAKNTNDLESTSDNWK